MATSGISIALTTRDEIIQGALEQLGVIGEGQTPSATQYTKGARWLNMVVSEFRVLGMPLWKRTDYNLTLVTGQQDYVLGVGQAENTAYPVHLYQARLQVPPYDSDIEMNLLSFPDFNLLPSGSEGIPVNVNYQPQINKGTLSVWPIPDASVPALTRIVLTYQAPTEIFNASGDNPDFPQEWYLALVTQLAWVLAPSYGIPEQRISMLEKSAATHLSAALSNGAEDASVYIQPNRQ